MAHFVSQLLLVVFVTLFSLSKGSEHQCQDYYQNDIPHDGLICPNTEYDRQHNLTYCCQTITGNWITEDCCTKGDWEKNPDSNPNAWSWEPIVGICVGGTFVLVVIVACTMAVVRRRRRSAIILNSRCAAQTVVIGEANPCYDPRPRVGQYRQFDNPPSYPIN